MQAIHKILFIRTDRMGDVLMNLPAIRLLRQSFPKAWITLCLDQSVAELLRGHPDLDELMVINAKEVRENFNARWKIFKKIRTAQFDLAVISNPEKWSHALVFLAGIQNRIGTRRKWGFLLTKGIKERGSDKSQHEIDRNLRLVNLVSGQAWDGMLSIPIDERSRKIVEEKIKKDFPAGKDILVVHPGTSNPRKKWSVGNFALLCESVQKEGSLNVALIGGEEEKGISEEVVRQCSSPIVNWTGVLSLQELAALFHQPNVRALVSSDSGPVHVAWISGTPVVALYAKNVEGSNPDRWGPRDGVSETIYKPMNEISVDEVRGLVKKVLGKKALKSARVL